MNLERITHVYFLGIGGIGMSALARFFLAAGKVVAGYDKTQTQLTDELVQSGMDIHFEENVSKIPASFLVARENVLVVWTPAVPVDHAEMQYFRNSGYRLMKRAEVLGLITSHSRTLAIAGTHGKTTTTTLTTHLLRTGNVDCSAFLGGISGNYHTNLLLANNLSKTGAAGANIVVVEADEYDRSFLWLSPSLAVVTSVDPDHLDIYGTKEEMYKAYRGFMNQVKERIVTKEKVLETLGLEKTSKISTYSLDDESADCFAQNIRVENGYYMFDLSIDGKQLKDLRLGLPGRHNVENAVAAAALACRCGVKEDAVRKGLESFRGVARRFDFRIRTPEITYIDDYGHHPAELKACISSVRELFPGKKIAGIFQPHLYSRTRDFADEFARSLSLLDDIILLEIYPAREKPISGISAAMLLDKINKQEKAIYRAEELVEKTMEHDFDVLITMGAGDIDRFVQPLEEALTKRFNIKQA
jgi:UDP-N-acetylmuramate--alanine ligase